MTQYTKTSLLCNNGNGNAAGSLFAIGSIQQSMLDEADFQTEMGTTDWVLCDGSDITGSALAAYIGNTLPDTTGRFLRSAGGSAASMRTGQDDATAKNGLVVSGGTASGTFASSSHNHDYDGKGTKSYGAGNGLSYTNGGTVLSSGQTFATGGPSSTSSVSSTAASLSTGDAETRPINITVNTFIKIN